MPSQPYRVLIVDDSVAVRRVLTQALNEAPEFTVVGEATNGRSAVEQTESLKPDVIVLDLQMPVMDGLEALSLIRERDEDVPIVVFSSPKAHGGHDTFEALRRGATDYVPKPSASSVGLGSAGELEKLLIPKLLAHAHVARSKQMWKKTPPAPLPSAEPSQSPSRPEEGAPATFKPKIVVVGVSTGGPDALRALLSPLPADFPVPILVVQHMPASFTRMLAKRLNTACKLSVREADHECSVERGTVLIAPGDYHMLLAGSSSAAHVELNQDAPECSCRPAVDPLFRSAAEVYGGSAIGVVLTGMGRDGLAGTRTLTASGAKIFAQDRATSVVWGMPGAVVQEGLANEVLPIQHIAGALVSATTSQQHRGSAT